MILSITGASDSDNIPLRTVALLQVPLHGTMVAVALWASIKKGLSVSMLALSWSLTLVMIGLCFVVPIGAIAWGVWKVARRGKKPAAV